MLQCAHITIVFLKWNIIKAITFRGQNCISKNDFLCRFFSLPSFWSIVVGVCFRLPIKMSYASLLSTDEPFAGIKRWKTSKRIQLQSHGVLLFISHKYAYNKVQTIPFHNNLQLKPFMRMLFVFNCLSNAHSSAQHIVYKQINDALQLFATIFFSSLFYD